MHESDSQMKEVNWKKIRRSIAVLGIVLLLLEMSVFPVAAEVQVRSLARKKKKNSSGDSELQRKIETIAGQCRQECSDDPWEQALWLHDWLTANARYDESASNRYKAAGVLLNGAGVCQGYSLAYKALLEAVGIESRLVESHSMDHTWNVVKLNGDWCHVDVTWDDPAPGGNDSRAYFGLSDALMARDHTWKSSEAPECLSDKNAWPIVSGECAVVYEGTEEELQQLIDTWIRNGKTEIPLYDAVPGGKFDLSEAINNWWNRWAWKYSLVGFTVSGVSTLQILNLYTMASGNDSIRIALEYTEDRAFEAELCERLAEGDTEIQICEGRNISFDPMKLYMDVAALITKYAGVYNCRIADSFTYYQEQSKIVVNVSYRNTRY